MAVVNPRPASPSLWQRRSVQRKLANFFAYTALLVLSAFFLIPFLWMVSTAFKDGSLIYKSPPVWIPPEFTLENFKRGMELMLPGIQILFFNSAAITILTVLGALLSSSLVGFAFAILPARGKQPLFLLLLSTLMIPFQVTLVPQFILFARLGWRDTWLPLVVPHFFAQAFFVFMFRQFFASIPRDLFDSAEIDGCSPLGLYWLIGVPLSKPAFATAAIFSFLGAWNDLISPLLYLSDMRKFTFTLGLANLQGAFSAFLPIQHVMPMALLGIVPLLIIFFLAQKYFVQGIVTTGIKG
jgi:multiple sugar transport system permease protein